MKLKKEHNRICGAGAGFVALTVYLRKMRFPTERPKFPPQKPGRRRIEQAKQAEQMQQ